MIDIVIPTLNRLDKQITLSNIPDTYRMSTTLVVQPHEAEETRKVDILYVSGILDNVICLSNLFNVGITISIIFKFLNSHIYCICKSIFPIFM